MKKALLTVLLTLTAYIIQAQIVVNPDGSHSVVHGSVAINPDGTHSVIHGSVVINPNGTHSILVGSNILNPDGRMSTLLGDDNNDNGQFPFKAKPVNRRNAKKESRIGQVDQNPESDVAELLHYLETWKERQKYERRKERKRKRESRRAQKMEED